MNNPRGRSAAMRRALNGKIKDTYQEKKKISWGKKKPKGGLATTFGKEIRGQVLQSGNQGDLKKKAKANLQLMSKNNVR